MADEVRFLWWSWWREEALEQKELIYSVAELLTHVSSLALWRANSHILVN